MATAATELPGPETAGQPPSRYHAFISYSHRADRRLAPAIQSALNRFGRPWYRLRWMAIFRDDTDLGISPHLWVSIEDALRQSKYFVLLASPGAAQSKWVAKEVEYWRANRPADRLLIVLTDGEIEWDADAGDFNWQLTTALPRNLAGAFAGLPLLRGPARAQRRRRCRRRRRTPSPMHESKSCKKKVPKGVLALPDLEHAKPAVLRRGELLLCTTSPFSNPTTTGPLPTWSGRADTCARSPSPRG